MATTGSDTANNCLNQLSPCATITYALTQADPGDYIFVAAGTYTEPGITIGQSINIIGSSGSASTIVQAAAPPLTSSSSVFIINSGTVSLTGLTIKNGGNGSGPIDGGGIYINSSATAVTLNNSVVAANSALADGGGIYALGGTLTINNSTITDNHAVTEGAGIWLENGNTTINSSTISSNVAINGGGIFNNSTGALVLNNSTVSNNEAQNGGGIANLSSLALNYSTISTNVTTSSSGGGIFQDSLDPITFESSLVAGNFDGSSLTAPDADCFVVSGLLVSNDYNLTGSGTGCILTGAHDQTVNPSTVFTTTLNQNLANNGGPTLTQALISPGPAVNQIPLNTNSCGHSTFSVDQRGDPRPGSDASCSIGAYEFQ